MELKKATAGAGVGGRAIEEPIGLSGTGSFSGNPRAGAKPSILVWMEIKMTMECQFASSPTVTHKLPVTVLHDRSTFLAFNLN